MTIICRLKTPSLKKFKFNSIDLIHFNILQILINQFNNKLLDFYLSIDVFIFIVFFSIHFNFDFTLF